MTDADLIEFATEFRNGLLGDNPPWMMCFVVCAPLVTLLGLYGVEAKMVEGELCGGNHVWLELDDGRVLDPTADQFNDIAADSDKMPPVYLGPPMDIHPHH